MDNKKIIRGVGYDEYQVDKDNFIKIPYYIDGILAKKTIKVRLKISNIEEINQFLNSTNHDVCGYIDAFIGRNLQGLSKRKFKIENGFFTVIGWNEGKTIESVSLMFDDIYNLLKN